MVWARARRTPPECWVPACACGRDGAHAKMRHASQAAGAERRRDRERERWQRRRARDVHKALEPGIRAAVGRVARGVEHAGPRWVGARASGSLENEQRAVGRQQADEGLLPAVRRARAPVASTHEEAARGARAGERARRARRVWPRERREGRKGARAVWARDGRHGIGRSVRARAPRRRARVRCTAHSALPSRVNFPRETQLVVYCAIRSYAAGFSRQMPGSGDGIAVSAVIFSTACAPRLYTSLPVCGSAGRRGRGASPPPSAPPPSPPVPPPASAFA
eukprot:6216656-Prymnesium_polylepis.1